MNSKDKGDVAELEMALKFKKKNFIVSFPYGDNAAYDLLIDNGIQILRIQCKHGRVRNGCILFVAESSTQWKGKRVRTNYSDKIDAFGVYCSELNKHYLIPVNEIGIGEGRLRLEQTKNNNRSNIRWAKDFEI
jgi:hypothetical protein